MKNSGIMFRLWLFLFWPPFGWPLQTNQLYCRRNFDLNGTAVSTDTFSGKLLGLYFSASWSDPCRKFSPKLVVFRNANENEFEVLLVSSDGNAKLNKIT